MAKDDFDDDSVGGGEDLHLTYGGFKKEIAMKRFQSKG